MTFLKENMDIISVDHSDEWQTTDDHWTIKIYGLETYPIRMFDLDLENEYTNGWIDTYAIGDPINKRVLRIEFIITLNTGNVKDDRELFIEITSKEEGEMLYEAITKDASKDLLEFLEDSENEVHSHNMERIGTCVDVFDDFLEARSVRIPSSNERMEADDVLDKENGARIYGTDYDELSRAFKDILNIKDEDI